MVLAAIAASGNAAWASDAAPTQADGRCKTTQTIEILATGDYVMAGKRYAPDQLAVAVKAAPHPPDCVEVRGDPGAAASGDLYKGLQGVLRMGGVVGDIRWPEWTAQVKARNACRMRPTMATCGDLPAREFQPLSAFQYVEFGAASLALEECIKNLEGTADAEALLRVSSLQTIADRIVADGSAADFLAEVDALPAYREAAASMPEASTEPGARVLRALSIVPMYPALPGGRTLADRLRAQAIYMKYALIPELPACADQATFLDSLSKATRP